MDRALPDVRDGLKPSQRRILVAMNDLNLGPRSQAPQVRKDRRRHLRQLSPARRSRHLSHAGPPGPGLEPALPADRRAGQFRLHRRRSPRRHAIHRSPHGPPPTMNCWRISNLDTVDFQPNYDERLTRAHRPARQVPEPAGERIDRHRRGHGVQPAAAQPARNLRRDRQGDRQSRLHLPGLAEDRPGPRFPDRRHHLRHATESSKATKPAAAGSRFAPRFDVEDRTRIGQSIIVTEIAVRHHPQDDRGIGRRGGEEGPDQGHLRRSTTNRAGSTRAGS